MQNGKEITKVYYFPLTVTLFERTAYGNNVLFRKYTVAKRHTSVGISSARSISNVSAHHRLLQTGTAGRQGDISRQMHSFHSDFGFPYCPNARLSGSPAVNQSAMSLSGFRASKISARSPKKSTVSIGSAVVSG